MGNAPSSDDDSSSTSSQYSRGAVGGNNPPIPKGTPGTNTITLGESSQPGDRRVNKRTAAAVQDSALGEDPKKKARNKEKEGSHYATGALFRTDNDSSSNSGNNNNNSHGVAGAVSNSSNKPRAFEPQKAQPLPTVQVPPRGIGPVHEPNLNDVLSGRGRSTDAGNVQFREIVAQYKEFYCSEKSQKFEGARIAAQVVAAQVVYRIRSLTPPGRFLKEDTDGLWFDIGDAKAIKKVQKALSQLRVEKGGIVKGGERAPRERNTWEQRYQELIGFHAIHGHFNIPQRDKWKTLYKWAHRQKHRRAGSYTTDVGRPLTQDQIRKLDAIGFDWTIKKRGRTRERWPDGSSGGDRT